MWTQSVFVSGEVSGLLRRRQSVLVVWYWDVLVVVAAVVGREEELGSLSAQARAQGLVTAQHRRQVLGLLRQLLDLLSQGGVLLLQVLALLQDGAKRGKRQD